MGWAPHQKEDKGRAWAAGHLFFSQPTILSFQINEMNLIERLWRREREEEKSPAATAPAAFERGAAGQ